MTQETIKLICKGILLYITMIVTMIFMAGVDSLSNKGLLIGMVIIVGLFYACKKAKYTDAELDIILGNALLRKWSAKLGNR